LDGTCSVALPNSPLTSLCLSPTLRLYTRSGPGDVHALLARNRTIVSELSSLLGFPYLLHTASTLGFPGACGDAPSPPLFLRHRVCALRAPFPLFSSPLFLIAEERYFFSLRFSPVSIGTTPYSIFSLPPVDVGSRSPSKDQPPPLPSDLFICRRDIRSLTPPCSFPPKCESWLCASLSCPAGARRLKSFSLSFS